MKKSKTILRLLNNVGFISIWMAWEKSILKQFVLILIVIQI